MMYPRCRECGVVTKRITLAWALRIIPNPPAELRARDRLSPTFMCPVCRLVAVLRPPFPRMESRGLGTP